MQKEMIECGLCFHSFEESDKTTRFFNETDLHRCETCIDPPLTEETLQKIKEELIDLVDDYCEEFPDTNKYAIVESIKMMEGPGWSQSGKYRVLIRRDCWSWIGELLRTTRWRTSGHRFVEPRREGE